MPIVRSAARNERTGSCVASRARRMRSWRALAALRGRESVNEVLARRRRLEFEAGQPLAPVLSELLLERWRAGDWTVMPQDLLAGL